MQATERQFETAEAELVETLDKVVSTLGDAGVDGVLIGGIAVAVLGRPRWTHDIDIMVRPQDAMRALDALAGTGMETEQTDHAWLFKAFHGTVLVDLVFRSHGDLYLDDEMVERSRRASFKGVDVSVVAPEDLLVFKALVHDEDNPRHWHDALALVARCELDWDYVRRRARHGRRRLLSLLLYAQSNDLPVPRAVVNDLWADLEEA
jgi:predicted nucleotidyltransferase